MKISDVSINSLSNYSIIIREIRKHLRNEIKKRIIKNNAFNAILNDEKNDEMKIIISHASKKQRVNIRKKFKSTNKSIKRSCWACEKKEYEIQKCWYIFFDFTFEFFVIFDAMQQQFSKRIKNDSKLKKKINQLKKKTSNKSTKKNETIA